MKKKFLGMIAVVACLFMAALGLTACGGEETPEVRYNFTVKAPEHCVVETTEGNSILAGNPFNLHLEIADGYAVQGDLMLKINDQVVEWSDYDVYNQSAYNYSFTPNCNFEVVISGKVGVKTFDLTFEKNSDHYGYNEPYNAATDQLYIKIADGSEYALDSFLNVFAGYDPIKYNGEIEFWVYAKNLGYEPDFGVSAGDCQVTREIYYVDSDDQHLSGYHIKITAIKSDIRVSFLGATGLQAQIVTDNAGTIHDGATLDNDAISIYADTNLSADCKKLTINLKDANLQNNDNLVIKINGETIDRADWDSSDAGDYITIALRHPFEYTNEAKTYTYLIDVNFYDLI